MAWAALSDAYYGVYCLMLAIIYVAVTLLRVTRISNPAPRPFRWLLDVLIVCLAGLIAGLVLGRGGEFTLLGVPVRMRSLYNPMLILTVLVVLRIVLWWRPRFELPSVGPSPPTPGARGSRSPPSAATPPPGSAAATSSGIWWRRRPGADP